MSRVPENADRDFTASIFIVNNKEEVLLMRHSKLVSGFSQADT